MAWAQVETIFPVRLWEYTITITTNSGDSYPDAGSITIPVDENVEYDVPGISFTA